MTQTYTVVLDHMLDLGLNPGEILCFATIYGFSQDGESEFTGSRSYLARKMAAKSRSTVDAALAKLMKMGLVTKSEKTLNGVKFCSYRAVVPAGNCAGCPEFGQGGDQKLGIKNKEQNKEKICSIAREVCPNFGEEFSSLISDLYDEKKWGKKSEHAWRLSLAKLAAVPEVEACEMIRRTIAGGWQGIFELDARDKSRLYGQPFPPFSGNARPAAAPKSSVMSSEALVQAAMEKFNA